MAQSFKQWQGSKSFKQSTSLRAEKYKRTNRITDDAKFIANTELFGRYSSARLEASRDDYDTIRRNKSALADLKLTNLDILTDAQKAQHAALVHKLRTENKSLQAAIDKRAKRDTQLGKSGMNVTDNHVRPNNGYNVPQSRPKCKAPKRSGSVPKGVKL